MKINIFYSWQSTTSTVYNKNFIRKCIDKAIKNLKNKPELKGVEYYINDSVRGEPGSPPVAGKIFERVKECEIFIADLSVVNNEQSWLIRLIRRFKWAKLKPFQNNNVIMEYGVAYSELGVERIIGVLNSFYGSPNDNPDNIPFDIRHLRFPIEYNYSKNKNKDKVQKELIDALTKAIKGSSLYVLKNQKEKYRPFKTWNDWNSVFDSSQKFHKNEFIEGVIHEIKESIVTKKESLRLIGLSGLGKSRVLLETFRPIEGDQGSLFLSSRVLYYDFQENSTLALEQFIITFQNEDEDRIIILDNCNIKIHKQLLEYLKKTNNKLSLITIDSNPEESELGMLNINYIHIKTEDLKDIVGEIIDEDFSYLEKEQKDKIKEFSQGIPLMATLLLESAKNGGVTTVNLGDTELLDKLLGEKGKEEFNRGILRACSLFDYIGFDGDCQKQLEYIAKDRNITSVDISEDTVLVDKFTETCNHFLKRGIFERRGRYIRMRPFPLAVYLAEEWLDTCTAEKMSRIIENISNIEEEVHKRNISDSFAKQMRYLNFNPKAIEIIEKLVVFGPFHDAKVLNTELGSRLFRSFVEVNPVATSNTLWNVFGVMSTKELSGIYEGRRNLVWALQKLCFDRRTFEQSAKTLFLFALAENENWSNNATGELLHLFRIFLPGTEADFTQRFNVLKWCYNREDEDSKSLALKCAKSALESSHFSRMMGAEEQGITKLKDYEPKVYEEIYTYWKNILDLIIEPVKNAEINAENCIDVIISSFRAITRYGKFDLLESYLLIIFDFKKWDFDQGLKALKQVRKYDKKFLSEKQLNILEDFIQKLSKNDFKYKFINAYEHFYLDFEDISYEKEIEYFNSLAVEFIQEGYSWDEYFPILFSSKPNFTFYFGNKLYELLVFDNDKKLEFIDKAIHTLENIQPENRNYSILGGFIDKLDEKNKALFYNKIFKSSKLQNSLFSFISNDLNGKEYFYYLFKLIEINPQNIEELFKYTYNRSLSNSNTNELKEFYNQLLEKNEKSYLFIFESIFNIVYDSKDLNIELKSYIKEIVCRFGKELDFNDYKISNLIEKILENDEETEFARLINKIIIENISYKNTYHLDFEVKKIYEILISKYFKEIWDDLSISLIGKDDNYIKFYGLKHILGSNNGSLGGGVGILFKGDWETIFNWAKENKEIAPERLAALIPVYAGNNDKYDELNPIAIRLLDNFGDNQNVVNEFSANMGTYSWKGSIVPLLEAKKQVFKFLSNHNMVNTRDWANAKLNYINKEIENEKNRDQEMYL
ncbi:hypothetical protein O2K51_09310 [Apibacter raozihei]|uniref:hypothetical protein n=1 Tax=Apibacter raozihei TaxID=2500547 RepID=UPI000FE36CC9|nr:hypothetical protein [Apibacter raozihei]